MEDFKGTKGKWYIGEHRQNGIQIGCNQSHYAACAYRGGADRTDDEVIANAQLIACAPELLSMLSQIVEHDNKISDLKAGTGEIVSHAMKSEDLYEEAKKIINKALGKEATDE